MARCRQTLVSNWRTLPLILISKSLKVSSWLLGAMPYVRLASAALLVVAGAYIVYYWLSYGGGATLPG